MKKYLLKYINTFIGRPDDRVLENCIMEIDRGVFVFYRYSETSPPGAYRYSETSLPGAKEITKFLLLAIPMQFVISVEEVQNESKLLS